MKIFIIAGEPSGDLLGGRLLAALNSRAGGQLQIEGVGGPRMEEQGLRSLFPMTDLAVFGLAEVLPRLPLILRRMKETVAAIRASKPDLVVTIDAPDFTNRVARKLKGEGIPFVHYVAPTVWAWRPGRAAKLAKIYQHLLALFPFEPPYFEKVGLPCTFVGHPLLEAGITGRDPSQFRAAHGLSAGDDVLVVLPGSRRSELQNLLPVFSQVVRNLAQKRPGLRIIIPTLPHWHETIQAATRDWPGQPILLTSDAEKYDAFAIATAALAASGTVALELGLAGTPAVIAYQIHPLTYALYRRLIRVKYANLVNIMADKLVVPECLQANCTAEKITSELLDLITNRAAQQMQRQELQKVQAWLAPSYGQTPSQKAAETVLGLIQA
jgi:lipid-A-disaccharide synthase